MTGTDNRAVRYVGRNPSEWGGKAAKLESRGRRGADRAGALAFEAAADGDED